MNPTNATNPSTMFRQQLPALLLFTLIFFVNFLSRIFLAPFLPSVEADLSLSHADAGAFFLLISLGYFMTLLCSGFISSHLTHRRTVVVSNLAIGLTLIVISFCHSLWSLRLGFLALGMAAGPYFPSGMASFTTLIDSRHWGKAIGIHELAPNLALVLAPLISALILQRLTWRPAFLMLGVLALLIGAVFMRIGRGGEFRGKAVGYAAYRGFLISPRFWLLVLLFCLGISGTLGLYTMLPLYLVSVHDLSPETANTLLALSRVSGIVMVLAAGWAVDRFSPKTVLRLVFGLSGLMTVPIGLASTNWVVVLIFLQPLAAVCFFPAGLAAFAAISKPEERNIALSLMVPIAFLVGGGAVPALIGLAGDLNAFGIGFALTGLAVFTGALLVGGVKMDNAPRY